MIVAAALCPSAPLLLPGVTGAAAVLPELRAACAAALGAMLSARPDVVVVAGADGPPVTVACYAPMLALRDPPQSPRPLPLLVADHLLAAAGWRGHVAPAASAEVAGRAGLLVVADGAGPGGSAAARLGDGLAWHVLYDDQPLGVRYLVAAATRSASAIAS